MMGMRLTVKTIDRLCGLLRSHIDEVRRLEREIRKIVVDRCAMPQERFIEEFPPNALNLVWIRTEVIAGRRWSTALSRNVAAIEELQSRLAALQDQAGIPFDEVRSINKQTVSYTHLTL